MNTQKKILIVGDGGVGKTSFIDKMFTGKFEKRYIPGNGIQEHVFDDLVIYDFPGQYAFSVSKLCDKIGGDVDLIVIMYDLTSKMSHCNTRRWKNYMTEQFGATPVVMIGNKSDIVDRITVHNDDPTVSVKTGSNLESVFQYFGDKITNYWDLVI